MKIRCLDSCFFVVIYMNDNKFLVSIEILTNIREYLGQVNETMSIRKLVIVPFN